MGLYRKKTKKLTFEKLDEPDLWIEYRTINSMTYREALEWQKQMAAIKKDLDAAMDAGDEGVLATEKGLEAMKILLGEMIKSWNFPDPDCEVGFLPVTSKHLTVFEIIPMELLEFMSSDIQAE